MSDVPAGKARDLTESIMRRIEGHLKEEAPGQHFHFNRTYSTIFDVLSHEFESPIYPEKRR